MAEVFYLEAPLADGSSRRLRIEDYHVATAIEFLDALQPLGGLFDEHDFFRGQGDSRWGLTPSAFRKNPPYVRGHDGNELQPTTYANQVALEATLLFQFAEVADRIGLDVPAGVREALTLALPYTHPEWDVQWHTWPPDELLRSLALAQHSGVPTRLLDWTTNPLMAAYFACHDACLGKSEALSVYVANDFSTSQPVPGASIRFCGLPQSENDNLRAQRGLMMVLRLGGEGSRPFTPTAVDFLLSFAADSFQTVGSAFFTRVTLPTSEAPTVLRLLHGLGVDGATAFPAYSGVARFTHEKAFWPSQSDEKFIVAMTTLNTRKMALYEQMHLPWRGMMFHTGNAQAVNGICTILPKDDQSSPP